MAPYPVTVHLGILQLVQAPLQALATVPAGNVHIERPTPLDAADCPGLVLHLAGVQFESLGGESASHTLLKATASISVRLHTRGTPQTEAADPALGELHAALLADPSLGGYAARLLLRSSRPIQAVADGNPGIYELSYEAVVLLDERTLTLQPI